MRTGKIKTKDGGRASKRAKERVRYISFLTPEELISVLRAARGRVRDWCMILIAYRHGLRTTEVCGLKISDVKNGYLCVQRVKGSMRTLQPLYPHPNEPLLDEVTAVQKWLATRPNDSSAFLFTSQKGGGLHRTQFFRLFQTVAKRAGLPTYKRYPSILKHSLAAHLLSENADIALINRLLGHRSMNSTLKYVKATDQQQEESADTELQSSHSSVYGL
jgi:type 1 fimbriae regulatory protein FimE